MFHPRPREHAGKPTRVAVQGLALPALTLALLGFLAQPPSGAVDDGPGDKDPRAFTDRFEHADGELVSSGTNPFFGKVWQSQADWARRTTGWLRDTAPDAAMAHDFWFGGASQPKPSSADSKTSR